MLDREILLGVQLEMESEILRLEYQIPIFYVRPMPAAFLISASRLGSQCSGVLLALWHRREICQESMFLATPGMLETFNITQHTGYRCLKLLEEAGLVTVDRQRGRSPAVVIKAFDDLLVAEGVDESVECATVEPTSPIDA